MRNAESAFSDRSRAQTERSLCTPIPEQEITRSDARAGPGPTSEKRLAWFVGRGAEMASLVARVDEVRKGDGQVVLIGGDAGIGKTRLLRELTRHPKVKDLCVCWGRCWEGEGAPVFWPWVQIVRSVFQLYDRNALARGAPHLLDDVARLLPEFREHLPADPRKSETPEERFRVFDSVTRLLRRAAMQTPIAILLDDLHRADGPSLRLLEFLADNLVESQILLLAAYRNDELEGAPGDRTISDLRRRQSATSIDLRGLDVDAVQSWMAGESFSGEPTDEIRRLRERTNGNPYFIIELVRAAGSQDDVSGIAAEVEIPDNVRVLVTRRLDRLPAECRRTLALGAVVGRDLDLRTLAEVAQRSLEAVEADMMDAARAHLVTLSAGHAKRVRFTHELVAETLYAQFEPEERRRVHSLAGDVLRSNNLCQDSYDISRLAHHYVQAGSAEKALRYTLDAAIAAKRQLAYEEAARHYRLAVDLLGPGADPRLRCEMLLELGDCANLAGEWEAARATFTRAVALAREFRSAALLARAGIGMKGLIASALPPDRLAIRVLSEASANLAPHESGLRARTLAALSTALYFSAERERQGALADESLRCASSVGDDYAAGLAHEAKVYSLWRPETIEQALEASERLLDCAARTKDGELAVRARVFRYVGKTQICDAGASGELRLAAELAENLHHPRYLWQVSLARASRALAAGDIARSGRFMKEAKKFGDQCHDAAADQHLALYLVVLHRLRGDLSELEDLIQGAIVRSDHLMTWSGLANIQVYTGRLMLAQTTLRSIVPHAVAGADSDAFRVFALCLLAEVAYHLGDQTAARQLLPELTRYRLQMLISGWGSLLEGSVAHFEGLLLAATGRLDEAEQSLRLAARVNENAGWALLKARSELLLADVLAGARTNGCPKAAALFADAALTYRELGLSLPQRMLRNAELAESAEHASGGSSHVSGSPSSTELAVAIVSEGDYCTVTWQGRSLRIRLTKGVRQLAALLSNEGVEIPALFLAGMPADRSDVTTLAASPSDAGPISDPQAVHAYRARIGEIEGELETARGQNDQGTVARLLEERHWIERTLRLSLGLGGRSRGAASTAERARVSVRNNIAGAINRIGKHEASLARHLRKSIRTGAICVYAPEGVVGWEVRV